MKQTPAILLLRAPSPPDARMDDDLAVYRAITRENIRRRQEKELLEEQHSLDKKRGRRLFWRRVVNILSMALFWLLLGTMTACLAVCTVLLWRYLR